MLRSAPQPALLCCGDAGRSTTKMLTAALPHFGKNQCLAFAQNQIDLSPATSIIFLDQQQTLLLQKHQCLRFACCTARAGGALLGRRRAITHDARQPGGVLYNEVKACTHRLQPSCIFPFHLLMTQPSISSVTASVALIADELERQQFPSAALYVLATPIGNTADISLRALKVLGLVDAIACEDTRNTAQLLSRYGLSKSLFAAHQHNEREVTEKIIRRLQSGERIGLVSDAGTPAISDPGARIVDAVLKAGLRVMPIAGASAAVAALSAAGLLSDQFYFAGFLPAKARQRETVLAGLAVLPATLVFYEAPHRINETVAALTLAYGPARTIVFARELSKLFEQIHRCPLGEAADWLAADPHHQRGEFVVLVEGAPEASDAASVEAQRILEILLEECPVSQAAALTAKITGQKKNALYELALQLGQSAD